MPYLLSSQSVLGRRVYRLSDVQEWPRGGRYGVTARHAGALRAADGMLDFPYLDGLGTASIRQKIEQDFAAGQSMSKSLLKASRRINGGDRRTK
jgi:hypothetical protein